MGLSFRVAPGVRIRASSRGVRTSIGPRAARLHVGGGRTAFSTGAGPASYYTSSAGSRRGASPARSRPSGVTSQRSPAQIAKAAQAQELQDDLQTLLNLHRQEFPPAIPPKAPAPPKLDVRAVTGEYVKRATAGIGLFSWTARKQARVAARSAAEQHLVLLEAERQQLWERQQQQLDEAWTKLCENDPDVVLSVLAESFEDNESPAAAVGVAGHEVSLVTLVPTVDSMPERQPEFTAAGNISLKKIPKSARGALHFTAVAAHVLLTVREAFAVAPNVSTAAIVALQSVRNDAYGERRVEAVLAARIERRQLEGIKWDEASALDIMRDVPTQALVNVRKAANELRPLDLRSEPDLAAVLDAVELDDLIPQSKNSDSTG